MRGGHDWTKRFPWIVETALKNRQQHFVIDGEAVSWEWMAIPT
jgi:ATP-dependent DNA ligase